jgi:tripartite-type tricarboxylate transporter receptor subunit TctC
MTKEPALYWINRILPIVIAVGLLFAPPMGHSTDFPKSPITLVIPWGAGGATDVTIRALSEAAQKILGQPIVVENRVGGGSAVGVGSIVGKRPDGYNLVVTTSSLHRNSYINKLSFDTVKDLTPIILVGAHLHGILVRTDSPFKSLPDLMNYARSNPKKLNYMASGIGTGGHIAWEETAYNAGTLLFVHLPSKGDQESSLTLLGGHVDFIVTTAGWISLVEAGKLRLLATYGKTRSKLFPNVTTVNELGYRVIHQDPLVIFGPKGMEEPIIKILQEAFHKAQDDPRFISTMGKMGMPIMYLDAKESGKYWAKAYLESGEKVHKFILGKK